MKTFTAAELAEVLRKHALWLADEDGGERADLREANLGYADLREANLGYADLRSANLRSANLTGANLGYANLRSADLREANLRYANLRSANLTGANLGYADLTGANLLLIGQDIRGYLFWAYPNDSEVVVIRAGCREFVGISAARSHWTAAHTRNEVLHEDCLSLVDRCERMANVRGWKLEAEA